MRFLSVRARMLHRSSGVQLPLSRRIPSRTTLAVRCLAFFVVCTLFLSVSKFSCRLSFLLSLDYLLDLKSISCFFVLRLPSLQSTWLLQRSVTVCCSFSCFCVPPRLLSASQLQFPLQLRLGVVLLSRQPSILVLLPCVDDFQYPCFSSSVQLLSSRHCSPHTSRPAVGTALSVILTLPNCWVCSSRLLLAVLFSPAVGCDTAGLLAMLFCHFVQLSEILVDLPLVVVRVLGLCAPFRQSVFCLFR